MVKFLRKLLPKSFFLYYHRALSALGSVIYHADQSGIRIIGVTGTDGKTTTTYFLTSIFEAAGYKVAAVSTIRYKLGSKEWKNSSDNTTPGRFELKKFIRQAVNEGCDVLILEVTSWGLVQSRVNGINFDAAVITNLTYEHLDLHKSFENYRNAKGKLFQAVADSQPKPGITKLAVVNFDDPANQYFLNFNVEQKITYGIETRAAVMAKDLKANNDQLQFFLVTPSGQHPVQLKLPGLFNVYNAMAAASVAIGWGVPLQKIVSGLEALEYVPGRMEKIDAGQPFGVIVDFAHTPNGMRQLFAAAKSLYPQGRVIAVYGATGGRDPGKRPLIGEVAGEMVDFSLLTSEDPRNEDPAKIAADIVVGLNRRSRTVEKDFKFVKDRAQAIREAVHIAKPGDVVLLCSMGCYDCMYVGDGKIPWDDRVQARLALDTLKEAVTQDPSAK